MGIVVEPAHTTTTFPFLGKPCV